MSTFFLCLIIAVCGLFLIRLIVARTPPRWATLDHHRPSRAFRGLILFGEDGSSVLFRREAPDETVKFTKRAQDAGNWKLPVSIQGSSPDLQTYELIERRLAMLGGDRNVEMIVEGSGAGFILSGSLLFDHRALDHISRLILRSLGHGDKDRYRVTFVGPKNEERIDAFLKKFFAEAMGRLREK